MTAVAASSRENEQKEIREKALLVSSARAGRSIDSLFPYYDYDYHLCVVRFRPLKDDDYYCDEIICSVPPNLRRLKRVCVSVCVFVYIYIYILYVYEVPNG